MIIHKIRVVSAAILVAAGLSCGSAASAQATRTWVSGVGDDVNPCSRTAPCKTFAGAISKTAAGGEINCLDPAGFGAVTITKSLTIDCTGTLGGILASSTFGITVNAAGAIVVLRGLEINGGPPNLPGTLGVRFLQGTSLTIEQSTIYNFAAASPNGFGVAFTPSTTAQLFITDTVINNNGAAGSGGGILIQPSGAGGSARVVMSNVRIIGNTANGIRVDMTGATNGAGVLGALDNIVIAGSTNGLTLNQPVGTAGVAIFLTNSSVSNNTGIGIGTVGPAARVVVGNTTIVSNGTGVSPGTGQVNTFGTNRLEANTSNGTFSGAAIPPQ